MLSYGPFYGPNCRVEWIGSSLDDYIWEDEVTGSRWQLQDKLSERCNAAPCTKEDICEAVAVYTCTDLEHKSPDSIMKVRMQIPNIGEQYEVSEEPFFYKDQATEDWTYWAIQETNALHALSMENCTSTPKLDIVYKFQQDDTHWVPGGFLLGILMERLPGVDLYTYWKTDLLPKTEREAIRVAFRKAITEVWDHGWEPIERASRNLIWDRETGKCYLVDLETFDGPHSLQKRKWRDSRDDSQYAMWGLFDPELDGGSEMEVYERRMRRREEESRNAMAKEFWKTQEEIAQLGAEKFMAKYS